MHRAGDPNREARELFSPLPRRYDRLAEVLSFGQNGRWRRTMVDRVADRSPAFVLDVATGTAGVALRLAGQSQARIVGLDLTDAMLQQGRQNVRQRGLTDRITFVLSKGEQLPFADASFDGLMFTYLLRYVADPKETLRELARVVKPGGVIANLEFFVPPNPFWRFWWWGYTRLVLPAAGRVAGREWYEVGRFLGPSISGHYRRYPLDWTVDAWRTAGIDEIGVRLMSLGGGLVMWGTKSSG